MNNEQLSLETIKLLISRIEVCTSNHVITDMKKQGFH